ncbi:type I-E CRISPR-associated protein Cas5/CasD [Streptomyces sp. NPDC056670]|uniref:type I-E CRISPR-associated protein Cas5/CasD n=1 Tax=Streptomyces sp. NPDC056670 TaxID=3345904 RepID=UPI0036747D6F
MSGLVLRLAGPLQSWGERSAFAPDRDSAPFPTRSALIGMFAAAEGKTRGSSLQPYEELEFTVRVDRPGVRLVDYHTVGGGYPDALTPATSGGKHKGAAVITRRHYLADAVFVVAVTGPEAATTRISDALAAPYWAPFLGRRSCVPDEPLLLRTRVSDPVAELLGQVPLSAPEPGRRPSGPADPARVAVEFVWERPPKPLPAGAVEMALHDSPVSFAPHNRVHGKRIVHRTVEQLPARLFDLHTPLHQQLVTYATQEESVA